MEQFFLDPNIAYLFLVGFFFLAGIAILSPGTGLLEVGALLTLIAAGWAIYNLPINVWALILLLVGVFPAVIAARVSGKRYFLWISVGALVVGTVFLFQGQSWWNPAVNPFLALTGSVVAGSLYYVISLRTLEAIASPPTHDLQRLLGAVGEARSSFHGEVEGSVHVQGELWSARSDQPIQEGQRVQVIDRMGFMLIVEPLDE